MIAKIDAKKGVCAESGVTPRTPSLTSKNPPDRIYPRKKTNIINIKQIGNASLKLNTPRAPTGPERIEDAMRRDTAAPLYVQVPFRGVRFFVVCDIIWNAVSCFVFLIFVCVPCSVLVLGGGRGFVVC